MPELTNDAPRMPLSLVVGKPGHTVFSPGVCCPLGNAGQMTVEGNPIGSAQLAEQSLAGEARGLRPRRVARYPPSVRAWRTGSTGGSVRVVAAALAFA